jgi:cation transport ATPase
MTSPEVNEARIAVLEANHITTLASVVRLTETTEKLDAKIDDKFDKLAQRLPVWATLLIAIMTACIGALSNAALQ